MAGGRGKIGEYKGETMLLAIIIGLAAAYGLLYLAFLIPAAIVHGIGKARDARRQNQTQYYYDEWGNVIGTMWSSGHARKVMSS